MMIDREPPDARPESAADAGERGRRAMFDPRTGEVKGSGSGAGGSGNSAEDYDKDPAAGAGTDPVGGPRTADKAIERPIDPDEGI